ncbi:hypothetical protein [Chitinophaga sp.]|uniref:hypothetical protein n=1 Tax=Chitinophaga sp. TaxID=1869181 RepID=UPI002F95A4BB
MLSSTNAQIQSKPKTEAMNDGRNPLEFMFPDLQRDLANLQVKEVKPQPDKAIISAPVENRLFTNYKAPAGQNKAAARTFKSGATPIPMASDVSATDAMNKLKAAQAAQPVKPFVSPTQGSEVNNTPVKKKS